MTFLHRLFYRTIQVFFLSFVIAAGANAAGALLVGQSIDLSGPNGAIGRDYVAGLRTAFDAINAAGGVNGRRINFVVRDDGGSPDATSRQVTELIERDGVEVLLGGVGDTSARATLANVAFQRSALTLYAPLANVDSARIHYWRPSYQQEIQYLLGYFEKLKIKRIGLAVQDSAMNPTELQAFSETLEKRGFIISGTSTIGSVAPQNAREAQRLAQGKPDFVVVIADTIGTAFFLKEFRHLDARTFVAGTSLINLATLREVAGIKAVEWTVFSQVVPNPAGAGTPLQIEHNAMMKKYRDEAVSSLTLEGYLVAKTLVRSMQPGARRELDLGGVFVNASPGEARLSRYLDIALFKKGAQLVF
ncbi:MAG: ABC transporter substrate-binding protein [Pseudomonadota bacterium]|nr:ABC transporter substrate-binding protein [Pseudomonadota bacterium]